MAKIEKLPLASFDIKAHQLERLKDVFPDGNQMIKALAERKPTRTICLDEGFQDIDHLKTNTVHMDVVIFRTV